MSMSDERKEYLYKYQKEKLKRIPLDVQKSDYDRIKAAADNAGMTVNGFIKSVLWDRIGKE